MIVNSSIEGDQDAGEQPLAKENRSFLDEEKADHQKSEDDWKYTIDNSRS